MTEDPLSDADYEKLLVLYQKAQRAIGALNRYAYSLLTEEQRKVFAARLEADHLSFEPSNPEKDAG